MSGVYKSSIDPNWFAENSRFWYRNDLRGERSEYIVVDVETGVRRPLFDHAEVAKSLSAASGKEVQADELPLRNVRLTDDEKSIRFATDDTAWTCLLETGEVTQAGEATTDGDDSDRDGRRRRGRFRGRGGRSFGRDRGGPSPDGNWHALVRDGNVFIRADGEDEETQLSDDGSEDRQYGLLQWSPDSSTLVAFRVEPGDEKEVYLFESSPDGGGRAVLHTRQYPLPGDKFNSYEINLFRIGTPAEDDEVKADGDDDGAETTVEHEHIKPEVDPVDFGYPRLRWKPDGRHFAYETVDRGHQRFRIIDVDAHTGESFNVLDEVTETFIWTIHTENLQLELVNWLENSDELIYVSEMDGWRHLYLVDAGKAGAIKQITQGEYVVRGIDLIDEENRQIWFRASGKFPGQDPYFIHYFRVNFDGTGLVALTEGNGNHQVQFSPDRGYLIDTYSRVDQPPVHELRRADDGKLIGLLEEADISELEEQGYQPLEVFVSKGRDGETDIWGVICRPRDFDPNKKYPVLESIYAGPQGSFVPKSFGGRGRYGGMADLGFIVVQIDGMGTANRSKAFHDACWHNLKDAGFLDRIPWMQAAAEKYPYMDTSRVGIYGGSAGGQNAAAAVLFHPEFYKAAVAGCGCHDNRMDKSSWNEQWMGYPVGPHYAECSNIDNAYRLEGKLMLILGEMDNNVPVESTFRLVDALIQADKDFDFVFVPGAGHGMGGEYGARRMRDFFVEHLQGVEPPDHNAKSATVDAAENPPSDDRVGAAAGENRTSG
jgi:dipeptidyl aminopeptidase/acylaminoacyl peptidase